MDQLLVLWLNRWLAADPARFSSALAIVDSAPWTGVAVMSVGLWFYGSLYMPERMMQAESRRRGLLLLASLVAGLLITHLLAGLVQRPPPLVDEPLQIPMEPAAWEAAAAATESQGSFPSVYAAMLGTVVVALFFWHPLLGWAGLLAGLYFAALQAGLGFAYPSGILGGAVVGGTISFAAQMEWKRFDGPTGWLLDLFERLPWLCYPLAFLLLLDLAQRFSTVVTFLSVFLGARAP